MQLDRFTEKAQEAIVAAQQLAQNLHSPVLAAMLARRARIEGGSLTLDRRATRTIELAQQQARRMSDEYVSTEHLLLGIAEVGGEAQELLERHGAGREQILQALQGVRGGQRVTTQNPQTTYQALEK